MKRGDLWVEPLDLKDLEATLAWLQIEPMVLARLLGVSHQAINQWRKQKATPRAFFALALRAMNDVRTMGRPVLVEGMLKDVRKLGREVRSEMRAYRQEAPAGIWALPESRFLLWVANCLDVLKAHSKSPVALAAARNPAGKKASSPVAGRKPSSPRSRKKAAKKKAAKRAPKKAAEKRACRAKHPGRAGVKCSRKPGHKGDHRGLDEHRIEFVDWAAAPARARAKKAAKRTPRNRASSPKSPAGKRAAAKRAKKKAAKK